MAGQHCQRAWRWKSSRAIGGDVRIAVTDPMRFTQLEAYESIFAYRQEEYIRKFGFSGTGNLAMHREDFELVGPFAGIKVAEDRDWGRRAKALGLQIQYVPDMIVYHPARVTFSELYKKWDRHIAHDASDFAQSALWAYSLDYVCDCSSCLPCTRIAQNTRVEPCAVPSSTMAGDNCAGADPRLSSPVHGQACLFAHTWPGPCRSLVEQGIGARVLRRSRGITVKAPHDKENIASVAAVREASLAR